MKQSATQPDDGFIDARIDWLRLRGLETGLPYPTRDELAAFHDGYKAGVAAFRSERLACFPKAVGWIRPWDGDDSDLGNFVIEWGVSPPADNHEWTPLYAEDEAVYESIV